MAEDNQIQTPRRGSPAIFATALGIALGFVVVTFGAMTVSMYLGERPLKPAIENYFAKYNTSDFAPIYESAAKPLHESVDQDKFLANQQLIHEKLGEYQSKTIRGVKIVRERGPAATVITYDATFAKGPATVALAFQGTGVDAKLVSTEFRSDLLPRPERRGRG